jgi:hypothetical protein
MCWPALAFSRTGQCGNSDSPHWPVPYLNFPHWPVRGNELGTGPVRGGGPRLHWPNPALASAGRGVRGRTGLTPHWPARRRPDPALAWRLVRIRALACLHQPVRRHAVATVVARNTSTDAAGMLSDADRSALAEIGIASDLHVRCRVLVNLSDGGGTTANTTSRWEEGVVARVDRARVDRGVDNTGEPRFFVRVVSIPFSATPSEQTWLPGWGEDSRVAADSQVAADSERAANSQVAADSRVAAAPTRPSEKLGPRKTVQKTVRGRSAAFRHLKQCRVETSRSISRAVASAPTTAAVGSYLAHSIPCSWGTRRKQVARRKTGPITRKMYHGPISSVLGLECAEVLYSGEVAPEPEPEPEAEPEAEVEAKAEVEAEAEPEPEAEPEAETEPEPEPEP